MSRRILQIIPAEPGWHVVYEAGALSSKTPGVERSGGIEFVPVACWALVEDASGQAQVIPLSGGGSSIALVLNDPKHDKALGISPPGRRPSDWIGKPAAAPEPKPKPKPKPKPAPRPKPEPEPEPEPEPIVEAISEPAPSQPGIRLEELLSPPPKPSSGELGGIPGGDVFDDD